MRDGRNYFRDDHRRSDEGGEHDLRPHFVFTSPRFFVTADELCSDSKAPEKRGSEVVTTEVSSSSSQFISFRATDVVGNSDVSRQERMWGRIVLIFRVGFRRSL